MMQESAPIDFRPIADLTPSIANSEFAKAGHYLSDLDENQELLVLAQVGQRLSKIKALGFLGGKDVRDLSDFAMTALGVLHDAQQPKSTAHRETMVDVRARFDVRARLIPIFRLRVLDPKDAPAGHAV